MHVLIVHAHPEPASFTTALKDAAVRALSAAGHRVEVSLYGEAFNPVAGRHDFIRAADPARFHYQSEQLNASRTGGFAADLVREQERLMRADLLVFTFPLWWGGLPAIVKGWFDRVCAYGVAYADGKRFDKGYFIGRRAILGLTTGGTIERFSAGGSYGEIAHVLHSVRRCILEYLGLEVMEPFVAPCGCSATKSIPPQVGRIPARDGRRSGMADTLTCARGYGRAKSIARRGKGLGSANVGRGPMDIHKIDRNAVTPLRILSMSAFSMLLSTLFLALSIAQAPAQTWPARPVTVIVPFTAGTTSDVLARGVTEYLASALGQPFPIDNRGGAGGNIAGGVAAKARPDGYALLFATTGPAATNKLMYKDLTFDPQRDFTPVILVGKSPIIIVARPDAPFGSLKELIDYAKANPNKLTAGFPGNGTLGHITGELLQVRSGIKFGHTQYRGSPQIMTDLIGGHIDIGMDSMAAYVSNVQEGKIKALAVAGSKRWSELPNVPTASESGLAGFEASVWYVLLARTGTPPEIIGKLNGATNDYLRSEQAKKFFESLGLEFGGGTPEDAKQFIAAEVDKWAPVIKAANISF